MQQVPGTFSLTWTEIQRLDLGTFDRFLRDKAELIEKLAKSRGSR